MRNKILFLALSLFLSSTPSWANSELTPAPAYLCDFTVVTDTVQEARSISIQADQDTQIVQLEGYYIKVDFLSDADLNGSYQLVAQLRAGNYNGKDRPENTILQHLFVITPTLNSELILSAGMKKEGHAILTLICHLSTI